MNYNIGNGYLSGVGGAATGAALGSVVPGIGTVIGAGVGGLAGLLTGFIGNDSSNSANSLSMQDLYNLEMYNTAKDIFMMNEQQNRNEYLMNQGFKLNKNSMRYGTDLQKELNKQAFDFNNYFIDNAYQKTVADMRKAGINPILAAGHANVGSAQAGSVTGTSNSAGSISSAVGHGVDSSGLMSAMANSANATTNKAQLGINAINAVGTVASNLAGTAKSLEQVDTEKTQQDLNRANTALAWLDKALKDKDLEWYDRKTDSDIKAKLVTAKASLIKAMVDDYLKESQKFYNYTSAKSQWESATTGSPTRAILQLIQGLTGNDPKGIGRKVGEGVQDVVKDEKERMSSGPSDYDRRLLKQLYDSLNLGAYGVKFE